MDTDGARRGPSVTETFELRIDSIAAGGDGVGRHDGVVVFVPRTSPGDTVRVEASQKGRLMRGTLLHVITPAPTRVDPRCPHYETDRCGGCQLQHMTYESQLAAKSGMIRDALTRIGKVSVDAPVVEPSDRPWRYRKKITLALRREGGSLIAGLHPFDAPDKVFDLRDCHITDEAVLSAWRLVRAASGSLPVDRELRVAVRLAGEGFALVVEGAHQWTAHGDLFSAVPSMTELWWKPEGKARRLMHSRTAGQAGASFAQVNAGVAAKLLEWVLTIAKPVAPTTAVDAFSGTGDIAVALAQQGVRVTAIEIDRDASRFCASRLPEGSRAVAASVEKALPRALPTDLVVLNPPRTGIDERVAETLQAQSPKPKGLIYVSCNPATLARDLRRLDRYRVKSLRGFDMFPQTAHVETVCELVPAA